MSAIAHRIRSRNAKAARAFSGSGIKAQRVQAMRTFYKDSNIEIRLGITGDKELERKLNRLGDPKQASKIVKKATRAAAKTIVLPAAKASVPVDSGDLKKSLKVRDSARLARGKGSRRKSKRLGTAVLMGDGLERRYAGHVELGTVRHEAVPILRPALKDNRQKIIEKISGIIRGELKKIGRS